MSATVNTAFANSVSHLPRWVNTLLVVLIGVALASLTVKLLPQSFDVDTSISSGAGAADAAPDPAALSQQIAAVHLFGNPDAKTEPVAKPVAPPVETRLNLQLAGVLARAILRRPASRSSVPAPPISVPMALGTRSVVKRC